MTKFFGTIDELKELLQSPGLEGEWEPLPGDKHQFTNTDGAVLNWWVKAKTVQFQGPSSVQGNFEKQVSEAIAKWKPGAQARRSPQPSRL